MHFHHLNSNITIGDVIDTCDLKYADIDRNILISKFLRSSIASENDLTFYNNIKYCKKTKSNFILTTEKFLNEFDKDKKLLISNNIESDIAKLSNLFYRSKDKNEILQLDNFKIGLESHISENSYINKAVIIGDNFSLGHYSTIDHNCLIGNNVKIGNNVSLSNAIIGDNVHISDGVKIGQPGFGFAYDKNNITNIFHIGRVIIQNGVNVGTNCAIDRGSFNDTVIGENTYIDNLVHIAHNVSIGNNCIIAGQCGFAGSAEIGNYVHIGGQTGIAGHIKINDGAKIAAKSGVIRDIATNETVMGYPAINVNKYLKNYKKNMIDT
jgi:UDP-3-O-[3-hydroxymyristoyl] glucosamine N-acyltransferase